MFSLRTSSGVKDDVQAMFSRSKGIRLRFWDTNYSNVLKYKRFFFNFSCHNCPKLKPTSYPVTVFLTTFDLWPTFSAVVHR